MDSVPEFIPYIVPVPAEYLDDDNGSSDDDFSVYTQEEMVYVDDADDEDSVSSGSFVIELGEQYETESMVDLESDTDSEIEEVNQGIGGWANPIDLTGDSTTEGETDGEDFTDGDETEDEDDLNLYLE